MTLDNLIMIFDKGGIVMYPLLILSLLSITFIIERSIIVHKLNPSIKLIDEYLFELNSSSIDTLSTDKFTTFNNFFGKLDMYYFSLKTISDDGGDIHDEDDWVDNKKEELDNELNNNMSYLKSIVQIAPLLGLLGTILGIISLFSIFDANTNIDIIAKTSVIGQGIGEALITSAFGVVIAVTSSIFYSIISQKIEDINYKYSYAINKCKYLISVNQTKSGLINIKDLK